MAKLSRDLATPLGGQQTLHPRESLFVSGLLGALNAEVITAVDGCSTVTVDLRGTFNLTVEVAGSIDGANWTVIPVRSTLGGTNLASIAGTAAGSWVGSCAGFRLVRARVTAYTSGAAQTTLLGSLAFADPFMSAGNVTSIITTATGAAAAAVTLTIGAPGAGLRHYITYLRIVRFASALLTAGTTPVLITTTNLPGALTFSFPADAAAQGTVFAYQEDFNFPVAASAQNTATTIVCPATTGVIWRVTAGHFVAP